jgi:hypothetical protein
MITTVGFSQTMSETRPARRSGERGAALAMAILMMGLLSVIALTVLAVVHTETKIAGSDLERTQACYASAAGIEKLTSDFSSLFAHTSRPTTAQFSDIADNYPTELTAEGYTFTQTVQVDAARLAEMGSNPSVTIPNGPFGGLIANLAPYTINTTAKSTSAECNLVRNMNNYLIPLFQFGMFSDEDIEIHPGPAFTFNGRVHANGNIYVNGDVKFLAKVTTANEFIYDVLRNGNTKTGATVSMQVGAINVAINKGSMNNGPNIVGTSAGMRGYFPGSPNGTINTNWNVTSVATAVTGVANKFGGQLLTRTTGAALLKLPLQLDGNPVREIIKRTMPHDSVTLSESRYHSKAEIRILIDDESPSATDAAGIPAGQGIALSTFNPIPLPNSATAGGGGRALWRIKDDGTYNETATSFVTQQQNGTAIQADTVRGVQTGPPIKAITGATNANPIKITCAGHGYSTGDKVFIKGVLGNTNANGGYTITRVDADNFTLNSRSGNAGYTAATGTVYSFTAIPKSSNGTAIPAGAGLSGRILIQVVDSNGVARDVTQQILSMGITQGEPNAIVMLQRPLWVSFTQGSRDGSGLTNTAADGTVYANDMTDIMNKTAILADGEIRTSPGPTQNAADPNIGYLTGIVDDTAAGVNPIRSDLPPVSGVSNLLTDWGTTNWASKGDWNAMVPINVYNVREGLINNSLTLNAVYERGITSVVELNMKNLARWMDGVYDTNLLAGTTAVSTNIGCPDGYVVYVSDRRGDNVRSMVDLSGATINSTNGMVDNEDIYGVNGTLDPGEDVQNKGVMVKDATELPDPVALPTSPAPYANYGTDRNKRAIAVAAWMNPNNYFRRAVRLFNGENLRVTGAANKLSATKGITVATENFVYIWGNYNTTGINGQPSGGSTLNDSSLTNYYLGNQVPASIVADAFFPLSKTWFDSDTALYPDDVNEGRADIALPGVSSETAVRAAIIAGNNLSALAGSPDAGNSASGESRLNGGMHNFPRFLEAWTNAAGTTQRWNFVGSLIPLYHSTQALGQYNADSVIYSPPVRNWAFDSTLLTGTRLPPGTPMFQYIEPTAFREVL